MRVIRPLPIDFFSEVAFFLLFVGAASCRDHRRSWQSLPQKMHVRDA
jgi:hypothetical protein